MLSWATSLISENYFRTKILAKRASVAGYLDNQRTDRDVLLISDTSTTALESVLAAARGKVVYIDSDDSWRATIANNKMSGTHLNLTDEQYKALCSKYGISAIPHYLLFDKHGVLQNGDAASPEETTAIRSQINKLLQ